MATIVSREEILQYLRLLSLTLSLARQFGLAAACEKHLTRCIDAIMTRERIRSFELEPKDSDFSLN